MKEFFRIIKSSGNQFFQKYFVASRYSNCLSVKPCEDYLWILFPLAVILIIISKIELWHYSFIFILKQTFKHNQLIEAIQYQQEMTDYY